MAQSWRKIVRDGDDAFGIEPHPILLRQFSIQRFDFRGGPNAKRGQERALAQRILF